MNSNYTQIEYNKNRWRFACLPAGQIIQTIYVFEIVYTLKIPKNFNKHKTLQVVIVRMIIIGIKGGCHISVNLLVPKMISQIKRLDVWNISHKVQKK